MNELVLIISLPILIGVVLFLLPEKVKMIKGIIALVVSAITFYFSIILFQADSGISGITKLISNTSIGENYPVICENLGKYCSFNLDSLSKLIIIFIALFSFLILLYSLAFINKEKKIYNYYPYFLITMGSAYGAALANNLIMFLIFWGILALTLYKLIKGKDEESAEAAKKTLIIVGASDGIMILGIGVIWKMTGSITMSEIAINTNSTLAIVAFLPYLLAVLQKLEHFLSTPGFLIMQNQHQHHRQHTCLLL